MFCPFLSHERTAVKKALRCFQSVPKASPLAEMVLFLNQRVWWKIIFERTLLAVESDDSPPGLFKCFNRCCHRLDISAACSVATVHKVTGKKKKTKKLQLLMETLIKLYGSPVADKMEINLVWNLSIRGWSLAFDVIVSGRCLRSRGPSKKEIIALLLLVLFIILYSLKYSFMIKVQRAFTFT